jgi:hypothetical protein
MFSLRRAWIGFVVSALASSAIAQANHPVPPLPNDPLELATGPTLVVDTPERRALVLGLLERARQNGSELYAAGAPPFTLRTSFMSAGSSPHIGYGEMEETRFSRDTWRWSVHLGDYSQLRIFQHNVPFDQKTSGAIPLRIQMVRGALLWSMYRVRPGARMRMASARWNGIDVMCALLSGDEQSTSSPTSGRRWEEREYCVDPKDGLLRIYSEAPGIYITYDYSNPLQFHGRALARQVDVVEDGNPVLQIHVESIHDPDPPESSQFTPTQQMFERGPGIVLLPPGRFTEYAPAPKGYGGAIDAVVIHAAIDAHGKVGEAEALQNADPNLSSAALAAVKRHDYPHRESSAATAQTEAFIEVVFGARSE